MRTNKNLLAALAGVSLLWLVFATPAFAQTGTTGDLTGTVTDASGAVVPNAVVTLASATGQSQEAKTNDQGQYRFSLLRPGDYTLTVNATGLQGGTRKVAVSLGQVTNVPLKLVVAGTATTIEVTGETPILQTENANIATTFASTQLAEIPVAGGDVTSYAYTAPGVVLNTGSGYGNFSSFGLPSTANLFTTNGNDNMDPYLNLSNSGASNLAMGANELQEIAVVNNGYTAQYGRQAGAQVNASTKSGTNDYHGNAVYWWNGRAMNANEWFNNNTGTPRPFANNNQWAASVGGPIVKNKLFFFADTEGLRYVLPGAGGAIYLPTPQFASYVQSNVEALTPGSGAFYKNLLGLYSGAPGANRATPVTSNDDPTLGCGDFTGTMGFGETTPCAMQFRSNQNNLNTEWLLATRIDWNIGARDHLSGRFRTDHGIQATGTDPINPVFNANSVQPEYEGQLTETHTFGSTAVNQFILSGMWYQAKFGPSSFADAVQTFPYQMQFNDGLFTTLGGADNGYPQGRVVTQWMVTDDFSKTWRSHDLKFGVNFRRNIVNDFAALPGTAALLTINSMTEFADGQFEDYGSTFSRSFPRIGNVRMNLYTLGLYAQDQWRVNNKLNLTFSLRVDNNSNPSCSQDCFSRLVSPFANLQHDANVAYNQVIDTGLKHAFPGIQALVWQPRFGFAYNLYPNTVIRGGVGFFSDLFAGTLVDRFLTNAPNVATFSSGTTGAIAPSVAGSLEEQTISSNAAFQHGFANGATLSDLQDAVAGFTPPAFNSVVNTVKNPNFLEWNFAFEQQIGKPYSFQLNYVGNHGYNVMTDNPWDNAYCRAGHCPFGNAVTGTLPSTVPDARFAQVRTLNNAGWSNYNGLTASFKARYTSNFQWALNYTWSHSLDTCSNQCLLPFTANNVVSTRYTTSPLLPGTAYGNSDYDVRQNLNANYVYTTKNNWNEGWKNTVLGGWTLAGTVYFHTGYPYTPVNTAVRGYLRNVTGLRNATPVADFLGGPVPSCGNPNNFCLDQSQFASSPLSDVTQSGFGNIARNSFFGPGYFDTDMNLTKNFKITERLGFAVGANFFNLFNHPNFDLPVNNVAAGNFGQILNTVVPATTPYGAFNGVTLSGRIVQMNARLTF